MSRVLVTGTGGPSGSRSCGRSPTSMASSCCRPTSTRIAAGLYLVGADRRAIAAARRRPGFRRRAVSDAGATRAGQAWWCRPSTPSCCRWRAPASDFAEAGIALVLAQASTLAVCLDKWALHERCRGTRPGARDLARRRRVRAGCDRAAGDRQAAVGQRLARDPPDRGPRRARARCRATGRCWSRSTCPAPSTRSTCSRAPTATSPPSLPRERLEGRLRDRGHRPDAARRRA